MISVWWINVSLMIQTIFSFYNCHKRNLVFFLTRFAGLLTSTLFSRTHAHFLIGRLEKKLRVLMPFQRTFRKSLRRFEERVADPSENLWDDLSKVWRNRFQNTGLIIIWGVCFWVLHVNKLQLIFSRNPTTYFR